MKLARSTRPGRAVRSSAPAAPSVPHRQVGASRCVAALAATLFAVVPTVAHPAGSVEVPGAAAAAVDTSPAEAEDRPGERGLGTRHPAVVGVAEGGPEQLALASMSAPDPKAQPRQVCVRRANVRSGPGLSHRVVTTLGRGARVGGPVTRGWIRLQRGRWISVTVTCRAAGGAATVRQAGDAAFNAWVRVIDPRGNAQWKLDHARAHTKGSVRGLTVFRGKGPGPSTVYIQPGMTWSKTKLVMAHEALHVRQIRYGGFAHSLRVFGSVGGMERAADCGATLVLRYAVRGGCAAGVKGPVLNLLAGRPA